MYAYPQHVTPRLIEVMASQPAACHYLDLPLQHSHPEVLRRMRRPHHIGQVEALIERLRAAMPDIALRTSLIVGYPGETEAEFEALLAFVERSAFDHVGVFQFSPEEGTPAAGLPDPVPAEVKQARYELLMERQQAVSLARNRALLGHTLDVLIEGQGDGLSVGRTYRDAPEIDGLAWVEGERPAGELAPALITSASAYDVWGEWVGDHRPSRRASQPRRRRETAFVSESGGVAGAGGR
jgi:ribosomal protein S12 methylthiotransferase